MLIYFKFVAKLTPMIGEMLNLKDTDEHLPMVRRYEVEGLANYSKNTNF